MCNAIAFFAPLGPSLEFPIASLRSIVDFKRLAGSRRIVRTSNAWPRFHGPFPEEPIPGLES